MNISNRPLTMKNSVSTNAGSLPARRRAPWGILSIAIVTGVAALLLASCKKGGANAKPADVDYYTCTMHPSVKKQNPTDKCPICSMDMVPVKKKGGADSKPADVDYYTCTMHPSVKKQKPTEKCPICSMDMVPVKKKGGADSKPADVDYYTCTMHPSVKKHNPKDKCPICSMDLTPVMKRGDSAAGQMPGSTAQSTTTTNEDKPGEFSVPLERQQQIGVTYATIEKRPFQ